MKITVQDSRKLKYKLVLLVGLFMLTAYSQFSTPALQVIEQSQICESVSNSSAGQTVYNSYNVLIALDTSLSIENSSRAKSLRIQQTQAVIETLVASVLGRGMDLNLSVVTFDKEVLPVEQEVLSWKASDFSNLAKLESELNSFISKVAQAKGNENDTDFNKLFYHIKNDARVFLQLEKEGSRNVTIVISDMRPTPNTRDQINTIKAAWVNHENLIKDNIELYLFALDTDEQSTEAFEETMSWWEATFVPPFNDRIATIVQIDSKNSGSALSAFNIISSDLQRVSSSAPIRIPLYIREPKLVLIKSEPNFDIVRMDREHNTLRNIASARTLNPYQLLLLNNHLFNQNSSEQELIETVFPPGTLVYLPNVGINPNSQDFSPEPQIANMQRYFEVWKLGPDDATIEFADSFNEAGEQYLYFFSGHQAEFGVEFSAAAFYAESTVSVSVHPGGNDAGRNEQYKLFFIPVEADRDPILIADLHYDTNSNTFNAQFIPSSLTSQNIATFSIVHYKNEAEIVDSVKCVLPLESLVSFDSNLPSVYDSEPGATIEIEEPLRVPDTYSTADIFLRGNLSKNSAVLLYADSDYFFPSTQTDDGWLYTNQFICADKQGSAQFELLLNYADTPVQEKQIEINCLCKNSRTNNTIWWVMLGVAVALSLTPWLVLYIVVSLIGLAVVYAGNVFVLVGLLEDVKWLLGVQATSALVLFQRLKNVRPPYFVSLALIAVLLFLTKRAIDTCNFL